MYTAILHILSTVWLPQNILPLVKCHCVQCCLRQSVHCLPHTVPSPVFCFYAHWFLPNFVNGISTKHCTTFVSVSPCALLFSKFCPVSLYRMLKFLLVLCHVDLLCFQPCVQFLPSLNLTICLVCVTMSTAAFYSLSTVSTSHCTVCLFCVTMSTAAFYSLFTVCQYLTLYRLLVLCHYDHFCLLQSVHCLSEPHTVPSVASPSLCHCCFLQSVHCLSVLQNVPSNFSVSLCRLLSSTVFSTYVSTSHCTSVVLYQFGQSFLPLPVNCLRNSHRTVCCFCVTIATSVFYSLTNVCQ